jgi:hypothetical protein
MTEAAAVIEEVANDQAQTQASTETGTNTATATDTASTDTTGTDKAVDTSAADTGDKAAALPDNWRELASGGDKDVAKILERYSGLQGVAKALLEKERLIRSGKIKQDMPDPKDEKAMAAWRKDQGIPEKAEDYKIPEPITKRLIDADKPVLANFTEFALTKNAPPAFVEMAAEWYVDMSEKAAEEQRANDDKATEEADDALREAWSRDEYKGNITLAKRFWESSGVEGLSEARLPDGRRLGDIPGFVQFSSDHGRSAFGDAVFASTDAENKHTGRKAEIEKVLNTDIDRYYSEGLDKEYSEILQREQKRARK